jgi:hypothetical protein
MVPLLAVGAVAVAQVGVVELLEASVALALLTHCGVPAMRAIQLPQQP